MSNFGTYAYGADGGCYQINDACTASLLAQGNENDDAFDVLEASKTSFYVSGNVCDANCRSLAL